MPESAIQGCLSPRIDMSPNVLLSVQFQPLCPVFNHLHCRRCWSLEILYGFYARVPSDWGRHWSYSLFAAAQHSVLRTWAEEICIWWPDNLISSLFMELRRYFLWGEVEGTTVKLVLRFWNTMLILEDIIVNDIATILNTGKEKLKLFEYIGTSIKYLRTLHT